MLDCTRRFSKAKYLWKDREMTRGLPTARIRDSITRQNRNETKQRHKKLRPRISGRAIYLFLRHCGAKTQRGRSPSCRPCPEGPSAMTCSRVRSTYHTILSGSLALSFFKSRSLSMQSSNPPSSWLSSGVSLYPDSLNSIGARANGEDDEEEEEEEEEEEDETSSRTASTRVEFIIGSPTRKRPFRAPPWNRYFDSIDTEDGRTGEALAECDSLECADALRTEC